MARSYLALCLLAAAAIAGCASSPTPNYYLLEASTRSISHDGGVSVGLHPVAIPEHLRRSSILVDASNGALRFSGEGRWGEPLDDGIYRVSTLDLAAALGSGEIRTWPWSAGRLPELDVSINVLSLQRSSAMATLIADVTINDRRSASAGSEQFLRTWTSTPADSSDAATAAAYSDLVQAMNRDIAAVITAR